MLDVDITLRASHDLHDIKGYTEEMFGADQANLYLDEIETAITTIRTQPNIGKPVLIDITYRCFEVKKHRVFFDLIDQLIVIHAVLHQSQLPTLQLAGRLE